MAEQVSGSQLMSVRELAGLVGWSEHTIYQRRYRGDSLPRAIKLGNGLVRYRRADVDAWLDEQVEPGRDRHRGST